MKATCIRLSTEPAILYTHLDPGIHSYKFGFYAHTEGHLRAWIDWMPEHCPVPEYKGVVLAQLFDTEVDAGMRCVPPFESDPKVLNIGMRIWGCLEPNNPEAESLGDFVLQQITVAERA